MGPAPGRPGAKQPRRRRRADVEELVGEGLVAYAAQQGSPAALALLSGIACLGTPRQAAQAEQAALALMERGVARPGWAEHVGAVAAADCYVNSDAYGDRDEVVCVFSYAGQEQHALVVIVDYNAGGLARDGWVTSQVGKLLDYCGPGRVRRSPRSTPPQARRLLESALAVTETATDPPVSSSFPSYHAFIRARVRTLPPTLSWRTAPGTAGEPQPGVHPGSPACQRGPGGSAAGGSLAQGPPGDAGRRSSSPPTRPRTCPTAKPPAAAPTTS